MSRAAERAAVRIVLALVGVLIGWIVASRAFDYFIENGVTFDVAAGYAVLIFALILGAFGLIAVKVRI